MPEPTAPSRPRLQVQGLKSPLSGPYDFEVAAGRCAVISGPSGSGKSLFLRMIADLDPNEGEVFLDGAPRSEMAAPTWRHLVPYVPSEAGWWLDQVADHFAPGRRDLARQLAGELGLVDGQFDGAVARLSTGEKQRLAVIRALVLDSPALLLDEPTSALDAEAAGKVEAVLKTRLAAGMALIMVSHDAAQARRLGAQAYEMVDRKLRPAP